MILVLMGVAGAGKTHVGRALATRLDWPFFDADDVHPPGNIARMSAGTPLSDLDREPWLDALAALLQQLEAEGRNAVLACSALRAQFRERLRASARDVRFVHLQASVELLERQLAARREHFMPPALLASQLAALEPPDGALTVDAALPAEEIVDRVRAALLTLA